MQGPLVWATEEVTEPLLPNSAHLIPSNVGQCIRPLALVPGSRSPLFFFSWLDRMSGLGEKAWRLGEEGGGWPTFKLPLKKLVKAGTFC